MRKTRIFVGTALAAALALGLGACASQPPRPDRGPDMARRGFNAQEVTRELSLFLPEELSKKAIGGPGGPGAGGQPSEGTGGAAASDTEQAGTAQSGKRAAPAPFQRDEKLFLTKDQIGKVVPWLTSLKDNLDPRREPKAKEIQKGIVALLTDAQKAEYAAYTKAMDELMRKGGPGRGPGGQGGQPPEGPGGGPGGQGGPGMGPGGGPGAQPGNPEEQMRKDLDAFISLLKDYQVQISGGV